MKFTVAKPLSIFLAFLTGCLLAVPVAVWSLQNQKKTDFEMVVQNGHANIPFSLSLSPDGKHIASGSLFDSALKLWNMEGKLIRTFKGYAVKSVSFSHDGKYILSGCWDGSINIWSIEGSLIKTFQGHSGAVAALFSPDGRYILSGSWDRTIKLWDTEGRLVRTFEGTSRPIESLAFSPDGKYIAGSCNKAIKLWSINGELIRTISGFFSFNGHSERICSLAFSPDGKHIVSASRDHTIKLWNINGDLVRTIKAHTDIVWSVSFSPDGDHIISGATDIEPIKLWDLNGTLVRAFKERPGMVGGVVFTNDGKHIVSTGGGNDTNVKLWTMDGKLVRAIGQKPGDVYVVSFSPDGRHLLSGGIDKVIRLWNMEGKLVRNFGGQASTVFSLSFSPDSRYFVAGVSDQPNKLWDIGGTLIKTFDFSANKVFFCPHGKYFVACDHDKIRLWNTDGKLIRTYKGLPDSWLSEASFSPDWKDFASWFKDKTLEIRIPNGEIFKEQSYSVSCVSFSPDGKYIVSEERDKTIKLWDMEGTPIRTFEGYPGPLRSLLFGPDGRHIASGDADGTIKLWDIEGRLLKTFERCSGTIHSMSFSPDGKYLASNSDDNAIGLWNINTGKYISLLGAGNDWIMYTPDGYFDASPHGGELVAMVKGLEAFGVDQFAARNNRPDLILERMGLGTPELITHYNLLYQKRLNKAGLTEADLSSELHAPEANITGTKQAGKFIDVTFSFSDTKYPLKRYNIYVNDVPLFGSSGKEIHGKAFTGTEKIELSAGRNKIELSAMNNTGAESFRALTYADYDGKEKGALYYLAFGASKYKDAKLSLNYADKDVKDLEAVLSKMRPAYSDIHVKTFLNSEVTRENIKKAKDFLKDAKTDDTVILAIAGHGGYSKGSDPKYYYVAYETDVNKLASTGVDFDSIEDLLDDIKPRKKLFLMDTCESGELDENVYENYYTLADARGMKPRTYRKPMKARGSGNKGRGYLYEKDRFIYNDLSRRTGAVVFSSSKGGEISYESSTIQNGFFTKEIINALTSKAADKNNDGKIDSGELRDFVTGAVSKATGGLQHPTIDRDNLYQKIDLPLVSN